MKPILRISFSNSSGRRLFKAGAVAAILVAAVLIPPATTAAADAGPAPFDGDVFHATDGAVLPIRSWLPQGKPKAVVLALHGFGDYSAAFKTPAALWAAGGVATYAYDQRGFGGSPHTFHWSGTDTMVGDVRSMVADLRSLYPATPLYLAGESMGGAIAIVATTAPNPVDVDGVILVSPAIWEHNLLGSIERSALWATNLTWPGLWLKPPRGLHITPSDNIEMLRALARDSLIQQGARVDTTAGLMDLMDRAGDNVRNIHIPTLVLFGAHDEILPHAGIEAFLARLPTENVRVAIYPQGYHMLLRDLHGETVSIDALTWMLDRKAVLPSGDECQGISATAPVCRKRASGVSSESALR
jgi:alpha-beta hydrolase superfamily lysophospholipase